MPDDRIPGTDKFLTAELLKLALESSGVAIWEMDPFSGIITATQACKAMFGLAPDEVFDYPRFLDILHPDDREPTDAAVQRAFNPDGDGIYQAEYRAIMPDGTLRWIAGRGRALFTDEQTDRKLARFIGSVRDITEEKTAETKLQDALEHQQVLLNEVNHRVKNSLQLVSSLLRLQARRIDDADMRHQIEDAMTRISTIAHIHQRLYRDQDVKKLDFGQFLTELCADLQTTARHCALHVDAPHIRIPVDCAIPLALAANELVTNAFKYAYPDKQGGPVHVRIATAQGQLDVEVRDQGVGLPDGFSVAGTKSLGMVLIASLLGQLHGKIEILDQPKGAGFRVSVPVEEMA